MNVRQKALISLICVNGKTSASKKTKLYDRFYASPRVHYIPSVTTTHSFVEIMRSHVPGECWTAGKPVWAWKREIIIKLFVAVRNQKRVILGSKHNSRWCSHYKDMDTSMFTSCSGLEAVHTLLKYLLLCKRIHAFAQQEIVWWDTMNRNAALPLCLHDALNFLGNGV